jgi:antitoxin component of MazEF toxin-antitoxin module
MTRVVVGRWGNNLAIRVPLEVAKASGLVDGEHVEIELNDGDLMIRRTEARARRRSDAEAAAAEIILERRGYTLGGANIRALREEGRRG